MTAGTNALPEPPDGPVSAKVTTTTALTDLLETLGVLSIASVPAVWIISAWLIPLSIAAGVGFFWWSGKRREMRAFQNENDLRRPQYLFTAQQLGNIKAGVSVEAANALCAIPPRLPVSRWQLLRLLSDEMGEARANETLPAVLRYAELT